MERILRPFYLASFRACFGWRLPMEFSNAPADPSFILLFLNQDLHLRPQRKKQKKRNHGNSSSCVIKGYAEDHGAWPRGESDPPLEARDALPHELFVMTRAHGSLPECSWCVSASISCGVDWQISPMHFAMGDQNLGVRACTSDPALSLRCDSPTNGVFRLTIFTWCWWFLRTIPIDGRKACTILEDLCAWDVVVNDKQAVLSAIDLKAKYTLSFWDSLILEAARRSRATTLYSEDFSNGQQVGGGDDCESLWDLRLSHFHKKINLLP